MSSNNPVKGGFSFGTRIKTQDGFAGIEDLKAGDMVLSCADDDINRLEYKPVTRIYQFPEQIVKEVSLHNPETNKNTWIACSANQSFFTERWGWVCQDDLRERSIIRHAVGSAVIRPYIKPIYRTKNQGVGWLASGKNVRECYGTVFDYGKYEIVSDETEYQNKYGTIYLEEEVLNSKNPFLSLPVYSIEVADNHNFFVGGMQILAVDVSKMQLPKGKPAPKEWERPDYEE